jgi:hypothetical protein
MFFPLFQRRLKAPIIEHSHLRLRPEGFMTFFLKKTAPGRLRIGVLEKYQAPHGSSTPSNRVLQTKPHHLTLRVQLFLFTDKAITIFQHWSAP